MSKSTQVSVPAPAPIIIPMNPPREPDGPQMVEKGTLDVVRDTTLARISANGAHVLTQMAIRHAAAQEEAARAINADGDPLLTGRAGQYMAQYDLAVNTAFRRIARPMKLK